MTIGLAVTAGMPATGAEILRQRLRWAAAEHRWSGPRCVPGPDPSAPAPFRGALRRGAQLTRFTDAELRVRAS